MYFRVVARDEKLSSREPLLSEHSLVSRLREEGRDRSIVGPFGPQQAEEVTDVPRFPQALKVGPCVVVHRQSMVVPIARILPVAEGDGVDVGDQGAVKAELPNKDIFRSLRLIGKPEAVAGAPSQRGDHATVFRIITRNEDDLAHGVIAFADQQTNAGIDPRRRRSAREGLARRLPFGRFAGRITSFCHVRESGSRDGGETTNADRRPRDQTEDDGECLDEFHWCLLAFIERMCRNLSKYKGADTPIYYHSRKYLSIH